MSDKMTIAQALRKIKKLKGTIAESKARAHLGVSYDVTKKPAFGFAESLEAALLATEEMVELECRVAVANANNNVVWEDSPRSLAFAVRYLQELKGQIAFLKGLNLRNETVKNRETDWDDVEMKHITRNVEAVFVSDLSEQERDDDLKELQECFETINDLVESANHTVLV